MASGDLYSSMFDIIRRFKASHSIDVPQFNSTGIASDLDMLPRFPYKQATMSIAGTGYYHEIGRFVAGFENAFPSCRIQNLDLSIASLERPDDREKLSFRMDIVFLVSRLQMLTAKSQ
jgi:hypothetical protein